jgi:spermidine/putrescine transport system substrate-binding protein
MKKAIGLCVAAGLLAGAAGCGSAKKVLHIYTWADYVKPELVAQFETDHQCKVVIDTFDSNEAMYAKIKAGAGGYDLIVPSSYMVKVMQGQGMLQDLQPSLLPNLKNIDPEYLRKAIDPEMKHSVPYMISYTGIACLKSRVTNAEPTWAMFDRPELKGRATMLNDMREVIGAALKSLGYSLNTTDDKQLEAARDVVIRWKKNLAKFENEQYKTGLASGEFLLVQGYSGDILQVQGENKDIEFLLPKEGFSIACDDMVIPKTAREVELAHAYMNFMHDPKVAATNTEFVQYLCPNVEGYKLLSEDARGNPAIFPVPEVRALGEVLNDLGADNAKYVKIWDQIKAAE